MFAQAVQNTEFASEINYLQTCVDYLIGFCFADDFWKLDWLANLPVYLEMHIPTQSLQILVNTV